MNKIELTCAKFFDVTNIPLNCRHSNGELLFRMPMQGSDIRKDIIEGCIKEINKLDPSHIKPMILTMYERYFLGVIPLSEIHILLVGPISTNPDSLGFPPIYETLSGQMRSPEMTFVKFTNILSLLVQLCTGQEYSATDFLSIESLKSPDDDPINTPQDSVSSTGGRISYSGEALEHRLLTFIERGDEDSLKAEFDLLSTLPIQTMSPDPVQHQKYLFIIFMTMAVRAAIKGGLNGDKAFEIIENSCLRMDKSSDIREIGSITYDMAIKLCRGVGRSGNRATVSPGIRKCMAYISSHLYNPLSLSELAKSACMSTRSLSEHFRQELGSTPMSYVQKARVHEAEFLLRYTSHSILDISCALLFNSQSHFTSVFKEYTGVTPRQYRDQINCRRET